MKENIIMIESCFEDCDFFAKWECDPKVTAFFTIDDGKTYEDTVREYLEREADPCKKQFTIRLKESQQPIGRIYISNMDHHYDSLDITRIYIADPMMRGRGYGEEALKMTLKWAFEEKNCQRVTLDHFTDNLIAASLYEKVGFKAEGVMRSAGKKNGKYVDLRLMSILKDEYLIYNR